ncbi:unnamed protein product [Schistocephalus solidus]|uniref:WD_REPEATS_REGION domain-containing protein n=1 Tax=Schistocephalus solidus TaxID=70667 RepID=A0A183SEN1_SCHSO|nr:unnamed protein product [Schistocephalus solidus]
MSRRHLESALVAGALIESGLEPAFRFTRLRFSRTLYPPGYEAFNYGGETESNGGAVNRGESVCCKCGTRCLSPAACQALANARPNRFKVEHLPSGKSLTVNEGIKHLPKHEPPLSEDDFGVHSLQFNGDGRQLVAGAANTSIRAKNQQTYCLDISPDGLELATAGVDHQIRIYGLYPGSVTGFEKPKNTIDTRGHVMEPGPISCERKPENFPLNNEPQPRLPRPLFPGGRPDQIVNRSCKPYIVNACYSTPYLPPPACEYPEPAGYSATPGNGIVIPVILGYKPTAPGENYTKGHSMRIMALRYHPTTPYLLASASWDNLVKIWDTRIRGKPVHKIYGPHLCSPDGLDMDGVYILTASWRKRECLQIWDMRQLASKTSPPSAPGDPMEDPTLTLVKQSYMTPAESIPVAGVPTWDKKPNDDQGEYLYAAKLLPSRAVVCGGSGFKEVRIVHRDTKLPILRIPMDSVVQTLDTVLEGRYIATGCASGSITISGLA